MAQVKIYGLAEAMRPIQQAFSDTLHACIVETLGLPQDKRFHRFILLGKEDFFYPPDRTEKYTIIEISMFEGRWTEVKKTLIRLLYERMSSLGIPSDDLEITIFETPRSSWGIRGQPATNSFSPIKSMFKRGAERSI